MNYMLQINRGGEWINQQRYTDIWDYRALHNSIAANMNNVMHVSSMGMHQEVDVNWRLKRLPDFSESGA